jgi:hypothetical protein
MRTVISFALAVLALWGYTLASTSNAQTPTTQWVNFYSSNTTLAGQPVSAGALIQAFDPSGVVCGSYTVNILGSYGFLACYIDDLTTPEDEGVVPGDTVSFRINGIAAGQFALPTAIQNGDRFRVDLVAGSTVPEPETALGTCIDGHEPDNSMRQARAITGPEVRTFLSENEYIDEDWVRFEARADWVYQITAYSGPPWTVADPYLRLYDAGSTFIAENDNYLWSNGAEIWWWNNGPNQTMYVQASEATNNFGCLYYTLRVVPWSPSAFHERFGSSADFLVNR